MKQLVPSASSFPALVEAAKPAHTPRQSASGGEIIRRACDEGCHSACGDRERACRDR
jgi:hypothetical protein